MLAFCLLLLDLNYNFVADIYNTISNIIYNTKSEYKYNDFIENSKLKIMVAEPPTVNASARYSINEACKLLGIHRHTLRAYTLRGEIRAGVRRASTRKFYLGSEIMRLWRSQY